MKHDEQEILHFLKTGEETALQMLFENYYQALCIHALRYLGSFALAEDVVQEVFTTFWEKRRGTCFSGSLRSFFFVTVRNASLNALKRSHRVRFVDIEDQVGLLFDDFDLIEEEEVKRLSASIKQEVEKLPPRCGEVFRLIVLEELQHKEVAERLDISINTVRTQYARALKLLRGRLDSIILLLLFRPSLACLNERV
ncbi:MAG: RNA polymerase sigma-70 factor [Odoribacteraceae bacterium]|nr:RNA polymerase sigma-70 factor [Odoribacteraceae bacterium]